MATAGTTLTSFAFHNGALRGTELALHERCLLHRGPDLLETIPLPAIGSVRVSFERDAAMAGWGAGLLVLALVMYFAGAPLAAFAGAAATELGNSSTGVGRLLVVLLRLVELAASFFPVLALALFLGGVALAGLGWIGRTTLLVSFGAHERAYAARGRDAGLLGFVEQLSEQLVQQRR